MEERGNVLEVRHGTAMVEVVRHEACRHCGGCNFGQADRIVVEATDLVGTRAGDHVALELEASRVLGAAFVVYLIPLAFLVLGLYLGTVVAQETGQPESSSIYGAILGLSLLGLAFWGVHSYDRRADPSKYRARITKILNPQEE